MMTDYMLTVFAPNEGHRDVQVNNCGDILEAIEVAEKHTGCRVSHGRGGVLGGFDPSIVIDAESGDVEHRHDYSATVSTEIVVSPRAAEVRDAIRAGKMTVVMDASAAEEVRERLAHSLPIQADGGTT